MLLNEIRALEAKVEFLRRHAGLAPAAAAMGPTAGGQHSLVDTELHNNLLRESMRNQQLQLLSAQSAMSELAMVRTVLCYFYVEMRFERVAYHGLVYIKIYRKTRPCTYIASLKQYTTHSNWMTSARTSCSTPCPSSAR